MLKDIHSMRWPWQDFGNWLKDTEMQGTASNSSEASFTLLIYCDTGNVLIQSPLPTTSDHV